MRKVAVLDHGMGNLRSVAKALEAAGADVTVTSDAAAINRCDAACLPGQGIFDHCMANLAAEGLELVVREWVDAGRPLLGICIGMQVLFETSQEGGGSKGLGILGGGVTRLPDTVSVPHIGWNQVESGRLAALRWPGPASSSGPAPYFYFDHSFVPRPSDEAIVTGWCEHGERFAAMIAASSITATLFHPEKSGRAGIALLEEWVAAGTAAIRPEGGPAWPAPIREGDRGA